MDNPVGILNNHSFRNNPDDIAKMTAKGIKEMMASLRKAIDDIPKPEHDCFVLTQEVWDRFRDSFPSMSLDCHVGLYGMPFWVEPNALLANIRARGLTAEGKRPLVMS